MRVFIWQGASADGGAFTALAIGLDVEHARNALLVSGADLDSSELQAIAQAPSEYHDAPGFSYVTWSS